MIKRDRKKNLKGKRARDAPVTQAVPFVPWDDLINWAVTDRDGQKKTKRAINGERQKKIERNKYERKKREKEKEPPLFLKHFPSSRIII